MSRINSSMTASNSSNRPKPFPGSKGDPRMNRAVAARLKDPDMSLLDALRAGGFTFPEGYVDGHTVDSDNVSLIQRKNQLNRRLRSERWRHEQQKGSSDSPCSNKNKKRQLTSSPATANEYAKRRNVTPDPEHDPFATTSSAIRRYHPSSPSPEIVRVLPSVISPPTVSESVQQVRQEQVVPPRRLLSPRIPTPIPLAAISLDGQKTTGSEIKPAACKPTSATDGNNGSANYAKGGGAGEFCQDDVDEEETAKHFLLKTFNVDLDNDPFFSEEEWREEKRGMPPEEHAAVLADLHGKPPTGTGAGTNAIRRSSLLGKFLAITGVTQANMPELIPHSIQALLQEMRERITTLQMQGSFLSEVDAAISWDLQSQSNSGRLELFLRREGMDAKLAAMRFVKYWTKRYEVFGRDNFRLPMTVNGAMRDDIRALETGSFRLMPDPDASGRRILFKASCFNTKFGYSSESMIRVTWYMLESLLEDPITAQKGIVLISWDRETSLWNCDRKLGTSFLEIERECVPIRFAALHFCSCTNLIINLFKPIVLGMLERRTRSRSWWHCESGDDLFRKLGACGITQEMLPIEMGGTSQFSHISWLRERMEAGK